LGTQPSLTNEAHVVASIAAMALSIWAAPAVFTSAPQLFQQALLSLATVQSESDAQLKSDCACETARMVALWASAVRWAHVSDPPDDALHEATPRRQARLAATIARAVLIVRPSWPTRPQMHATIAPTLQPGGQNTVGRAWRW
jgi:hypothetical protein